MNSELVTRSTWITKPLKENIHKNFPFFSNVLPSILDSVLYFIAFFLNLIKIYRHSIVALKHESLYYPLFTNLHSCKVVRVFSV